MAPLLWDDCHGYHETNIMLQYSYIHDTFIIKIIHSITLPSNIHKYQRHCINILYDYLLHLYRVLEAQNKHNPVRLRIVGTLSTIISTEFHFTFLKAHSFPVSSILFTVVNLSETPKR